MAAITYENNFTTLAGWATGSLADQKRGYAYQSGNDFIHFFGRDSGHWVVSSGLTFWQKPQADETVEQWAQKHFHATDCQQLKNDAGEVVKGVWRPGLFDDSQMLQALQTSQIERRAAEQALFSLVERLNDLLLYIEPEGPGLAAYGPRSRELLILACTEVENTWTHYMRLANQQPSGQGFKTTDYVKLAEPLHLKEFRVELLPYAHAPRVAPFAGWDAAAPTQSLPWYDAYNKTKHDRAAHLSDATFERCLEAVAANLVMFCVRFGPAALFHQTTPLSSLVNHLFVVDLVDPDVTTFYVPRVEVPLDWDTTNIGWGDSQKWTVPWQQKPLAV